MGAADDRAVYERPFLHLRLLHQAPHDLSGDLAGRQLPQAASQLSEGGPGIVNNDHFSFFHHVTSLLTVSDFR